MTITILHGDCLEVLKTLPADYYDCIVTSPPYWGLRSYLPDGHVDKGLEIGLEPTLDGYLDVMTEVGGALRRILKPTGTFWLNIGDSYAGGGRGGNPADSSFRKQATNFGSLVKATPLSGTGLKAKDLCMVPARLALSLQAAGWWVRSEIIWAKPNPMPESVTDRPTSSHEKIWLLTKSERYYFDADAVRENWASGREDMRVKGLRTGSAYLEQGNGPASNDKQRGHGRRHAGFNDRWDGKSKDEQSSKGRNIRNVWTMATQPFSEAHFATFPPELAERCIKAGCPSGGRVLDPFGGAGTTGLVADRLGRDATLIELNPAYIEIAKRRIEGDAPLFAEVTS